MGGAGRKTHGGIKHGHDGGRARVFLRLSAVGAFSGSHRAEIFFTAGTFRGRSGADDSRRGAGGVCADTDGSACRGTSGGARLRAAIPDLCDVAGGEIQGRCDVAGGAVFRLGGDRQLADSVAGGCGGVANAFAAFWIHVASRFGAADDSVCPSRLPRGEQGTLRGRIIRANRIWFASSTERERPPDPADRRPFFFLIPDCLAFDGKGFGEFERDGSFRRKFYVLSAGGARGCKSTACSDTGANCRAFAASSKAANERTDRRAAAGDDRCPLALAFLRAAVGVGCDHVPLAVNFNARQTDGQDGFALEGALFFGVDDASRNMRVFRNCGSAFNDDGFGDGSFKFVARPGYTRTDGCGQNDRDGSARGNDDRPRGFRSGLLRRCRLVAALLTAVGGWIGRGVSLVAAGGQSEHYRQSEYYPFVVHGFSHFVECEIS